MHQENFIKQYTCIQSEGKGWLIRKIMFLSRNQQNRWMSSFMVMWLWTAWAMKMGSLQITIGVQTNNNNLWYYMEIGQRNKWKTMPFGECHDGMCAQIARTNAQVNVSVIPRSRVTCSEHMRLNQRNWKLPNVSDCMYWCLTNNHTEISGENAIASAFDSAPAS